MNISERNEIALILTNLAEYFGRNISRAVVMMMVDDLEVYPMEQIQAAIKKYRQNPKNRAFPLPAQLIDTMSPELNSKNEAVESAAQVIQAVSKFGWSNPEMAKEYLGQLAWRIVERFGGWRYVCENLGVSISVGTFQAQARDLAIATIERSEMGLDNMSPQIKQSKEVLSLVQSNDMNKIINS